ncbi:AbrB family transcriptional regulator [Candidatus Wirthbacteria bacterium CG2_30_54_11]|uniref:AbrB family transcriptional regulator n=1 Tax=Candidatus Wirthbacteria bacterium CG2_30_54_11 TaxID=1817892 RepID=A0A1J5IRK0_9BACT|nr:MAG: AbrB family transcriptional regulator [Candidatus Wirthbacteria bacterium CG2_30_54_11]
MLAVSVSSKFQVVIPRDVRKQAGIEVGQKMHIIPHQDRLECIPLQDIKKMRGKLSGMDTDIEREDDRV